MESTNSENNLYLCKTEVLVPIVAKDEDEALTKFVDNWSDAVISVFEEVPLAVRNKVLDKVHHLTPDSIWEGYTPHGDYYGCQEVCRYYTIEEQEKRKREEDSRRERVKGLLSSLTAEEVRFLRDQLIPPDVREEVLEIISASVDGLNYPDSHCDVQ